jgi:hypothetical protein
MSVNLECYYYRLAYIIQFIRSMLKQHLSFKDQMQYIKVESWALIYDSRKRELYYSNNAICSIRNGLKVFKINSPKMKDDIFAPGFFNPKMKK